MRLTDTKSSVQPCAVLMDETEEGKVVRMAGNVREVQESLEDGGAQTIYVYDEVVFTLEKGRTETAQDIEGDFDAWWDFGSQEETAGPTLEERVAMLEDYIITGGDI